MITAGTPVSIGLALAIPMLLGALAYAAVIHPVIDTFDAQEQRIAAQTELRQHYLHIAAKAPLYQSALQGLRDDPLMRAAFLSGENSALAAATLQQQTKSIIQEAGGAVQSVQILPDTTEAGMRRITIRVRVVSDVDALRLFLMRIAEHKPLLLVTSLEVTSRPPRRSRQVASEHLLETQFDIVGFMREA